MSLATGVAYCVEFAFDTGKALFYNIPLMPVYVPTSHLIALAIFLVFVVGMPAALLLHDPPPGIISIAKLGISRVLFVMLSLLAAVAALAYLSNRWSPQDTFIVVALVIMIGSILALLLRAFYRLPKPQQTLVRAFHALRPLAVDRREPRASTRRVVAFYVLFMLFAPLPMAAAAGRQSAVSQTVYDILQSGRFKDYVLVWVLNDDLYVFEKYDPKHSALGPESVVLRADASHPVEWIAKHTGRLTTVGPSLNSIVK